MIRALSLALAQLADPAFRGVLWRGLGLTFLAYAALGLALWFGLAALPVMPWSWLASLVDILSTFGFVVLLVLLFPAVATTMLSLFLDDVAAAVEQRHYPRDPPGRPLPFVAALGLSLRFLVVVVGLNLLVLPLYLVMIWFPPLNFIVFYGLNGYLLGREYFELVAGRHLDPVAARRLRRTYPARLFLCGLVITFFFTVPVVNLLTPIVATALMVHIFKELQSEV